MVQKREDLVELVRSAGLRITASRVAVLLVLSRNPHVTTDTIIREVNAELGSISSQAVYNVLAAFVAAGLIRRVEPAGSVALYELRVADNHHHVVCRRCAAVRDVDCAVGRRPCLTPADTHGYQLDEAEVTYWGICPACQEGMESESRDYRQKMSKHYGSKREGAKPVDQREDRYVR
jgi:Fur family ferric uptake transcriptional regulator